jgi:hypothetical protein
VLEYLIVFYTSTKIRKNLEIIEEILLGLDAKK